jgi:hypothetical protein
MKKALYDRSKNLEANPYAIEKVGNMTLFYKKIARISISKIVHLEGTSAPLTKIDILLSIQSKRLIS